MESPTNNPDAATVWEVDIESSERRHTCPLQFQDIIRALQGVGFTVEGESQIWKAGDLCAVYSVLTVPPLLGTNLSVDHLGDVSGEGNQGSS